MTAAGVPADEGRRQRGFPDLFAEGDRLVGLTYWEDLLTFVLLAASQTAFALSIANADWVDEMPDLTVAAWAGMLVGVVLARLHTSAGWFAYDPARSALLSRVRWSAWWLFPAGLALGAAVSVAMVMHTMELADPFAMGIEARWSELWARLKDWGAALIFGGVSSDPMPFVLLMVFVTWIVPYLAGWAVFRWRNPWLALVPAGVGILTNISYLPGQPSIAFILFLFAAILLFTRLQLLRTIMRWQGQRAELPQLLSIEVLHAGAWVAVLLILASWIVPTGGELDRVSAGWERVTQPVTDRVDRFGQVFLGIDSKRGNLIHHFDNALPLQGRVKLEDEPMYAITLAADDELRGEEFLQVRSTAFDEYTRAGWKLSGTERDALPGTTIEAASFGTPETRTQLRRPVVTEIEVIEPLSDRRLLSVGDPLATDIEAELVTGPAGIDLAALQPDERVRAGDRYVTVGTISAANPEVLLGVGTEYPAWVTERYLQLPDSLPERVRELAIDIAGDANSAYLAAFQIENYLRNPNNYRFSLKVDDQPPRADPVDYFLFESGEGYFDHYASAMAVMMRSLGYPARVAVGFFVDSQLYDEETGAYVLTEEDSWTWPEVYFPGLGWVEFNPTPGRATVSRPGFAAFGGEDVSVLDIAEGTDETLFIEAGAVGDDVVATPDEQAEQVAEAAARDFTTPLLWLLAAVASLSALYFLVSLAWAFPYRQLAPATQRWAKVQRLSSWAGMSPGEDRTPIETAGTLGRVIEVGEPAHHLARSFTRERYGRAAGADDDEGEVERLDRSYREVRNRLVRLALLRPFRLRRRAPGT
ncbi:MAG: transglutaminase domain-containing protein [Chloroflexota bacterium]|nr:transglutaminase domain-containing protein [Chloroflexota bacterium]